jgi:hypothetical protein
VGLLSSLQTRAKVLFDHRYRHMYAQRRITDMPARFIAADRLAEKLPPKLDLKTGGVTSDRLEADGYAPLPDLISKEQIADIRAYLETKLTHDPYKPELGKFKSPDNAPSGVHVAHFDQADVVNAPHFLSIANNPVVLSSVSRALGAKPTISCMVGWWSIAHGEGAQHAELFHRDVDDLRFIKLFIYLSDVDEESGPHVFVQGTHKINKLTAIRRLSNDEVANEFGAENILRFTGPAGTAFLENTYGIHRGVPPSKRPRLVFQVLYSMEEYVGGPRRPLAKYVPEQNGVPLDPYVNRVYLSRD